MSDPDAIFATLPMRSEGINTPTDFLSRAAEATRTAERSFTSFLELRRRARGPAGPEL